MANRVDEIRHTTGTYTSSPSSVPPFSSGSADSSRLIMDNEVGDKSTGYDVDVGYHVVYVFLKLADPIPTVDQFEIIASDADSHSVSLACRFNCFWSDDGSDWHFWGSNMSVGGGISGFPSSQTKRYLCFEVYDPNLAYPDLTIRFCVSDLRLHDSETDKWFDLPAHCTYDIDPGSAAYPFDASSGSVVLITGEDCDWEASSDSEWLIITNGGSGVGPYTLEYDVSENHDPEPRVGRITFGGESHIVSQDGQPPPCSYDLTPENASYPAEGGDGSISVVTDDDCEWSASVVLDWITLTGDTEGTGDGTVTYHVDPNTGGARDNTIVIAGENHTIHQEAAEEPPPPPPSCTYEIYPPSANYDWHDQFGGVDVGTASDCAWSGSSPVGWIAVPTPTGVGPGTLGYEVAANYGLARSANLSVAGHTHTVNHSRYPGWIPPPPPDFVPPDTYHPGDPPPEPFHPGDPPPDGWTPPIGYEPDPIWEPPVDWDPPTGWEPGDPPPGPWMPGDPVPPGWTPPEGYEPTNGGDGITALYDLGSSYQIPVQTVHFCIGWRDVLELVLEYGDSFDTLVEVDVAPGADHAGTSKKEAWLVPLSAPVYARYWRLSFRDSTHHEEINTFSLFGSGPSESDDGFTWYMAAGAPPDTLGIDNDRYLNTSDGTLHVKVAGVWT